MYCITLESTNPFLNLAIEEILLKNTKEEYLVLGINNPSVIIGKHQSANMEVNAEFVYNKNIPVIRRISGGGTVFHDTGNLNFTFIRQSEAGQQVNFRKYTEPVIDFLQSVGVDAKFEGKNDLKVGGLKISGNAEHVHRKRILHHGTLLFSSSLEILRNSLRKDNSCYSSRAVPSNPSSVTNLNQILKGFKDIYEFRTEMMNYLLKKIPDSESHQLPGFQLEEAALLASSKYIKWEWNYAYGPEYIFTNRIWIRGNSHQCKLFVKEGIIQECEIEGSDMGGVLAKKLIGCRHMIHDLDSILQEEKSLFPDIDVFKFF